MEPLKSKDKPAPNPSLWNDFRHRARFWSHFGKAYFVGRQYAQAIESFMRLSTLDAQQHAFVAASYGLLGDRLAATAHVTRVWQLDPELDLQKLLAATAAVNRCVHLPNVARRVPALAISACIAQEPATS